MDAGLRRLTTMRWSKKVVHTVGISDMKVSDNVGDVLITYSLGSCIGVTLFDPEVKVGGLIHCMLPLSKIDPVKAEKNPLMFTDLGIPELLRAVFELGAKRENLVAKVAGAATVIDDGNLFRIGERNYTVMRKVLWKNNILIAAEDVAGTLPRTMLLCMATGRTLIRSRGEEVEL